MPLESGSSKAVLSHNIATERAHNKPEKQAVAIAYSKARGDALGSACVKMDSMIASLTPETMVDAEQPKDTPKNKPFEHTYHPESVNKAIASSKPKIGGKEASAIHRLLRGRHDADTVLAKLNSMSVADMDKKSHTRTFPGYTLAELKGSVKKQTDPELAKKMQAEIDARESGASTYKPTPQVPWK